MEGGALREYVAEVLGIAPDQITEVGRFGSGERHAVYKVAHLDETGAVRAVVVRTLHGRQPEDLARAEWEARVLREVAGIAAPALYDFRKTSPGFESAVMCMEFVPGRQRTLSAASAPEVEQLGAVVGALHGLDVGHELRSSATVEGLLGYAGARIEAISAKLPRTGGGLPAPVARRLRRVRQAIEEAGGAEDAESFRGGDPLALLHGDIGPGNVLWSPRPVLIDWEYARLGDPADEIAYLFDQNGLRPGPRAAFWRGYGETAPRLRLEGVVARVDWWEPLALAGSTLWWLERWDRRVRADATGRVDASVPKTPEHYLAQGLRRLNRLEKLMSRRSGL